MTDSAAFKPAVRNSDHIAAAPRVDEPSAGAQASGPRPAGGLRPSQIPVPGETARLASFPSLAGRQADQGLQRLRPSGAPAGAALPLARPSQVPARPVRDVLRGPGQPLATPLREEMEARLGADFSGVHVHTGDAARVSATGVGARAYTSGNHVVIGDGGADKQTLAHELTHVIQQRTGPVAGTDHGNGFKVSDPFDVYERAAEANAARVMRAPLSQHRLAAARTGEQCTPVRAGGESEQTLQRNGPGSSSAIAPAARTDGLGPILSDTRNDPAGNQANIDALGTGNAFSGVFDPDSGHFEARPSGEGQLVQRNGGHQRLDIAYFGRPPIDLRPVGARGHTVGFTALVQADGSLKVNFFSRSVNMWNHGDATAAAAHQALIISALRVATGRTVTGE